jgi:hypothetical protein
MDISQQLSPFTLQRPEIFTLLALRQVACLLHGPSCTVLFK